MQVRVCYAAHMADSSRFTESDPATWEVLPDGYYWAEIDATTGEHHLFAPDGRDVSAENEHARDAQRVEVLVSEELISHTFTVYLLVNGKITETVADHMTRRSARGVAVSKAQELGLAGYKQC